ncbi:class F sortase, partial [Arthrobacter sp. 3Tela_A]|uniref:class F sortase n=1 Tax=Arthrobacter sp. 3Tela_A TaxID=3093743 RepID=UPI003BB5AE90
GRRRGRRAGLRPGAAALLLVLAGCSSPPAAELEPGPSSSPPSAAAAPSPAAGTSSPSAAAAPAPSLPLSLRIPATGTESSLLHLGLREDGSLEVPPEGPGAPASWYTGSPVPGQPGPAVLLGHVNATGGGPGVFADLRALQPGDLIEVGREDGSIVQFVVERAEQYGKDNFPTLEVYGNTDGAELRLITCDGFDPATGTFDDNFVVYAALTG